jgi:hypothetical protein
MNCWHRPPDTPLELFNNYEDLITKWFWLVTSIVIGLA